MRQYRALGRGVAAAAIVALSACAGPGLRRRAVCRRPPRSDWFARPVAAERSATSSSSCKRTGASTTSSKAIPAPTRGRTVSRAPARRSRSCPSASTEWDVVHDSQSFFAACNGKGSIPGTDCRMNGFDKNPSRCGHGRPVPEPGSAIRVRSGERDQTVLGDGAAIRLSRQDVRLELRRQQFHLASVLIAGQASSAVDYP